MKRYAVLTTLSFLLTACLHHSQLDEQSHFFQETWRHKVNTRVDGWAKGASSWFFTGRSVHGAGVTKVKVPQFTNIRIEGSFQVQLEGADDHNYVVLQGPYRAAHALSVDTVDQTLYLREAALDDEIKNEMKQVVVRVGIVNLRYLSHEGPGPLEGAHVHSDALAIQSIGAGNIYLQGDIWLRQISQQGAGSVSVFGAKAHALAIQASGSGDVGVSGRIGLKSIVRQGCGEVNIVGAKGHDITISADSESKVGIHGPVDVREIRVKNEAGVYIDESRSQNLHVCLDNEAEVGIAGSTNNLYVDAAGQAVFYGRYLYARNAFIKTEDGSHANVTATNKIYASASDHSSIYFFGPAAILSSVRIGGGVVLLFPTEPFPASAKPQEPFFDE